MRHRRFADLRDVIDADPARQARGDEYRRAIRVALALAKPRTARGATQEQVAAALSVSQENVSRIERQDDLYLSTLGSYVAALGGHLEVNAVFADRRVTLVDPQGESSCSPEKVPQR